ncbi:MAG TPA: hypothetical protein PK659_07570 [Methanothrix sp.]|mgnify:CR=1 FL=1|nr:hypothetical protein [Methanothrix sp.]HOL44091.1 hypothetical protein [Methanothrix sp.]
MSDAGMEQGAQAGTAPAQSQSQNRETAKPRKKGGVPVKKTKPELGKNNRLQDIRHSYRGDDLDTNVNTRDLRFLQVPGNVDRETAMRLLDAYKRGYVTDAVFQDAISIENVAAEDLVTVVPLSVTDKVRGYYANHDPNGNITRRWVPA